MRVTAVDHLVVNVADTHRALAFYRDALGLEPVRVDEWEAGEAPFPSVRVSAHSIIDLMEVDRTGHNIDHFCLVVDDGLDEFISSGAVEVESGPHDLFGAHGQGHAFYVRDPDGNRVELREYR